MMITEINPKRSRIIEDKNEITPSKVKLNFKCPYKEISCVHVDTCGMSVEVSCNKCTHYSNEVRATGALPDIRPAINLTRVTIKRIIKFCGVTLEFPVSAFWKLRHWKRNKGKF